MKSMSIDMRGKLSTAVRARINEQFKSGSRNRFHAIYYPINGNIPSNCYYYKKDQIVNTAFGFHFTITPAYVRYFKDGEIEGILGIFKDITTEYSRIYYKVTRKDEKDIAMSVYCLGFREPEPDGEDNCMQIDTLQPMPTK